jgi:transcriptional regulator with XRE-family HTH domain
MTAMNRSAREARWLKDLGERIRETRVNRGLTLYDLGAELDVSHASISRWERGEQCPSAWDYYRLERWMGRP